MSHRIEPDEIRGRNETFAFHMAILNELNDSSYSLSWQYRSASICGLLQHVLFAIYNPHGLFSRTLQQVSIGNQIRRLKYGHPGLAHAKELAGAAQLQILFRDLKAVLGALHSLEPLARIRQLGSGVGVADKDAKRLLAAAPHAAAQLVQLRQAKRSACSMIITVALGTSTPTSTTVVQTKT